MFSGRDEAGAVVDVKMLVGKASDGSDIGLVGIGQNEFAVAGTLHSYAMLPLDAALTGADAATVLWNNATGCKAYRVVVQAPIGAGFKLLTKGSTTASDDLSADLNSADTELDTPTGGGLNGVVIQAVGNEVGAWQLWDGANPVKTISMRMNGGALTEGVILETIE